MPRRPAASAIVILAASLTAAAGAAGVAPALGATPRALRATDASRVVDPVLHDALLAYEVRAALLEQLGEQSLDVEVSATGGLLRLGGRVSDSELRSRAVWAAREVAGVKAVDDAIDVGPAEDDVAPPTAGDAADALLEARVKSRLLRALGPRAFRLAVEAQAGDVRLAGRIPSKDDKKQVVEAALRVPGVREVADDVLIDRSITK